MRFVLNVISEFYRWLSVGYDAMVREDPVAVPHQDINIVRELLQIDEVVRAARVPMVRMDPVAVPQQNMDIIRHLLQMDVVVRAIRAPIIPGLPYIEHEPNEILDVQKRPGFGG